MEKIRLGIIGCGGMGLSHLEGFKTLGDISKVTAVCDIDPIKAEKAKTALNADFKTPDYKQMLPHVDAVIVVLPHELHYECGMFFAENKKHILMEKPLCNTEEECLSLIEATQRNQVKLMCAYPVRYWPAIQKMKEFVDNKTYGDVIQMSVWTEQLTKPPEGSWGNTEKGLGGGQFFSHGCHYIDLLLWFLGKPISGNHVGTRVGTPWIEKEGTSNAVMKFESGALGYHFGTWGARGTRHGYNYQIHFTEGMIEFDKNEGKIYFHSQINPEKANMDTTSNTQLIFEDSDLSKRTQFETRHFIECIINDTEPLTNGPSALQSLRVIWKMYEAEKQNKIADLRGLGLDEPCK